MFRTLLRIKSAGQWINCEEHDAAQEFPFERLDDFRIVRTLRVLIARLLFREN